MKLLTFTLSIICFASITLAEDFKTVDGQEYKNATLSRVEPDGIVLITSSGISKVYFTELPKEVRDRFHYDAAQADAYTADQNAQVESLRKQREEARQKAADEQQKYEAAQMARQKARLEQQEQAAEQQRRARARQTSGAVTSLEGVPEHTYEITQDHTIQIRAGINGASIHLKRGERYSGRILADHAEIDIKGISYWVPVGILSLSKD